MKTKSSLTYSPLIHDKAAQNKNYPMLYGYRVADGTLTTQERRAVLSWIIDSGLLTKAEIIKDLQFKVRYNGSKKGNERAKAKWLDDIQFVSQYVMDNKQTINAAFVVRK